MVQVTTSKMLKKLESCGFKLIPDPEKIQTWVFIDLTEDEKSPEVFVTRGDTRDDLILETYDGIFLGKYRIS